MASSLRWIVFRIHACFLLGASGFDWVEIFESRSPSREKHAVQDLRGDEFKPYLEKNPTTAVLFYAPWCFYSQQVMPAWDTAAQKMSIHDPPVKLVKVDASRYSSVAEKYGVNAFPTMKLFVDDAVFEYDERGRSWQQFVSWINKHTDRDHIFKDVKDVDTYLHDNELCVIGLFPDGHNHSVSWQKASRHFGDVMFAEARGTKLATEVAEFLSHHVTQSCETVYVGASHDHQNKKVRLPRENLECSSTPKNYQHDDWTDKFEASVEGRDLNVKRTDVEHGWDQLLQMRCCEKQDAAKQKHNVPVPSLVMLSPHDERFAVYEGSDFDDVPKMDKWITGLRHPLVMRFTSETADSIMNAEGPSTTPLMFLVANDNSKLEDVVREAAKTLRGRVQVVLSGTKSSVERRFMDLAGIDEDAPPVITLMLLHGSGGGFQTVRRYRMSSPDRFESLKSEDVVKFASDYEAGKVEPWIKSEPVPTDDMGPVWTLVGTTYAKTVKDEEKDVLVDYYAPWCGHCQKFMPTYNELARKLKHVKSLRMYKIDATRNELDGMVINAFPMLILHPAGSEKSQAMYSGNRDIDDLVRWLKRHATHSFDERPPPTEKPPDGEEVDSGLLTDAEEAADL
eukprot:TRINITY_DN102646_c0_g1_i1.p1 TRINITY_DN102646_c0_g1~~TRINITY_DN102646_c0_g1_i1.p1  ORF type:complete len:622 (-),score=160.03 TRINITY_DN102646_c0_g1_i1:14-1879(-)